jgi:hypothetical protein
VEKASHPSYPDTGADETIPVEKAQRKYEAAFRLTDQSATGSDRY